MRRRLLIGVIAGISLLLLYVVSYVTLRRYDAPAAQRANVNADRMTATALRGGRSRGPARWVKIHYGGPETLQRFYARNDVASKMAPRFHRLNRSGTRYGYSEGTRDCYSFSSNTGWPYRVYYPLECFEIWIVGD